MSNPKQHAPDPKDPADEMSRAGQDGRDQDSNFAEDDEHSGPGTRGSELPRPAEQRGQNGRPS